MEASQWQEITKHDRNINNEKNEKREIRWTVESD